MSAPSCVSRALPLILLAVAVAILTASTALAQATPVTDLSTPPDQVTLYFYYGIDCQHCAAERTFLAGWQGQYPTLVVEELEVWRDDENLQRLRQHAADLGCNASSTPVTILNDRCWVGFDETTARSIEAALAAVMSGKGIVDSDEAIVDVPFFGGVDVAKSSLVVSALIIGFIDGVNPCSLWVLSVLLAIVLHSGSRGRVVIVGTTFLFVTAGMYALYMTGMYSALDYVGELKWIRVAVAMIALVFGLIHLKDYFWFKQGPSLSIDDAQKPGLYKRMRSVGDLDRSLPAVLGGTIALAIGVSLLETPCTAGLPLLWANLLASQGVSFSTALGLFGVYMAVFLLDELVVFFAAVITLRAAKVQEEHGRFLKLISGVVMVTLALAMVLSPASLESVSGTMWVFVMAFGVVAAVWVASWFLKVWRAR